MIPELVEEVQVPAEAVPIVVAVDKPGLQDHQEIMDSQAKLELPETPEIPDVHLLLLVNNQRHLHALHVLLALPDHLGHLEHREMQVQMAILGKDQHHHNLAHLDRKDQADLQDLMANLALQVNREHQHNLKKPVPVNLDLLVMPDLQDHLAQADNQVNRGVPVNPVQRGQMEIQALQEMTDNPEHQVKPENLEVLVKRESVPSTALSTVESSSKMELADVKFGHPKQRTRGDLPKTPCPMKQPFFIAQKTAICYASLVYFVLEWASSHSMFFLK